MKVSWTDHCVRFITDGKDLENDTIVVVYLKYMDGSERHVTEG